MIRSRNSRYYIDEEVLLLKAVGGNKKTGAGGIVQKAQKAMTCRTCFAIVGENHFTAHTQTHRQQPLTIKSIKREQK